MVNPSNLEIFSGINYTSRYIMKLLNFPSGNLLILGNKFIPDDITIQLFNANISILRSCPIKYEYKNYKTFFVF